jgi:hypothetical protein
MRRSDIWFFGVIAIMLVYIVVLIIFDIETIGWHSIASQFGLMILLFPFIIIKMTYIFFPRFKLNAKIFKWLNTNINE